MELSWQFRISHYLNKTPSDFKWLVKMLRNNDAVAPEHRREMDRVFLRYERDGQYPECLIKRLCQHFSEDTARDIISGVFGSVNREAATIHKDYNVKCPAELVLTKSEFNYTDLKVATENMLALLEELSAEEIKRVKVFLGDTVVEGVRHIPYGLLESRAVHDLSDMIVNRLHIHYKCVMFVILSALDRNDLICHLQVPFGTKLVT